VAVVRRDARACSASCDSEAGPSRARRRPRMSAAAPPPRPRWQHLTLRRRRGRVGQPDPCPEVAAFPACGRLGDGRGNTSCSFLRPGRMAMGIRMPAAWMVSPSCGTPASIGSSKRMFSGARPRSFDGTKICRLTGSAELAAWDIGVGSSAVGEGHPVPRSSERLSTQASILRFSPTRPAMSPTEPRARATSDKQRRCVAGAGGLRHAVGQPPPALAPLHPPQ